jgi:putative serine/threonine protein kinase
VESNIISLETLEKRKEGQVLCYPKYNLEELRNRIKELDKLGIKAIEFVGQKRIFDVPVLGKGCVGIVVIAYINSKKIALKIRRIDSDRKEMFNEGKMLNLANKIGIGPNLIQNSDNFLLMQLIEGKLFPEWLDSLEDRENADFRLVIKKILQQCFRLDEGGIDHGELSKAPKHIIIDSNNNPHLIDFETASIKRRVSNVTSMCQYFFLRSHVAYKVRKRLVEFKPEKLISTLRKYKQERSKKNFERILEIVL